MLPFCFTAALFVGSVQLFLVQPMVAKAVLPLLGGTPAVWNTCMVFFQCALLAGYLYAHVGATWLGVRRQAAVHVVVLLLSLLALPAAVTSTAGPPPGADTSWWLFRLLIVSVGVPFFVVSTTAPMLQRWFATTGHRSAADPYFLYAASNAGSILALLGYPAVIEPRLRLGEQAALWTSGYSVFCVLTAACAAGIWWWSKPGHESTQDSFRRDGHTPSLGQRARWIGLAFAPSSLLLGVTTFLTTDIAALPLLWVAPLAVYLGTFVLVFAKRALVPHALMVRGLPILVLPITMTIILATDLPQAVQFSVHLLMFFVAAMACHGELVRSRPEPAHLTEFYLCMSLGGALGGVFNALVAPVAFSSVFEYPFALAIACLLGIPAGAGWTLRRVWRDVAIAAAIGAVTFGLFFVAQRQWLEGVAGMTVLLAVPALACFRFSRQPVRFALGVIALVLVSGTYIDAHNRVILRDRSFFGLHRVRVDPSGERRLFVHGSTVHGGQFIDAKRSGDPLTYYHRDSPIGQVLSSPRFAAKRQRVAVVGLGVGTLAAYGQPGQEWVFYEIDPAVERIARDGQYFRYLAETRAHVRVVLGDARLSMADAPGGGYDLIVLDAFSSDAIPVHLLTSEALDLYRAKLTRDGLIAVHISNRHLDLEPVLGNLAAAAHMASVAQFGSVAGTNFLAQYKLPSQWVLIAPNLADLAPFATDSRWHATRRRLDQQAWTDDFSNVLSVFKWPASPF